MYTKMQQWTEIRRRVLSGEISKRAACREYSIHWDTFQKMLTHVEPPGYRQSKPRGSKVEPFVPIIHQILKEDQHVHRKQRHTAKKVLATAQTEIAVSGFEKNMDTTAESRSCRKWLASGNTIVRKSFCRWFIVPARLRLILVLPTSCSTAS